MTPAESTAASAPPSKDEARKQSSQTTSSVALVSLRRNFSWTLAGNMLYAACQWGILVLLTKFTEPEMVGSFALGLAIAAPAMLFANLSLRTVQVTDANRHFAFGDYLALRLVTTQLGLLTIAGVAFVGYQRETALVILAVGVGKSLDAVSDILFGFFQFHEQMNLVAKAMIVNGFLSLGTAAVALSLTQDVLWVAIGLSLASLATLVGYNIPVSRRLANAIRARGELPRIRAGSTDQWLKPCFPSQRLLSLVKVALPLGVAAVLASLYVNIPRYFLAHYFGQYELGIFAALAYLMVIGNTVMNAVAQAALPRLSKYYVAGNRMAFRGLLLHLAIIGLVLAVLGLGLVIVVGRDLLMLLYRTEYASHADLLTWLMVATSISFLVWFADYGISAARRFTTQVALNLVTVATIVVACILLIPPHGALGAAWAMVIAMATQTLLKAVALTRIVRKMPLAGIN